MRRNAFAGVVRDSEFLVIMSEEITVVFLKPWLTVIVTVQTS